MASPIIYALLTRLMAGVVLSFCGFKRVQHRIFTPTLFLRSVCGIQGCICSLQVAIIQQSVCACSHKQLPDKDTSGSVTIGRLAGFRRNRSNC
jgi:hypothetical protein